MKRIIGLTALISICTLNFSLYAQTDKGGISKEMLQSVRQSYRETPEMKALQNAIGGNDINKLALNRKNIGSDTYFSHRVNSKGITDQKSSGRCWAFTGMNVLRAKVIAKYNLNEFQFSINYIFFWDQLEKANLFLQAIIDTRSKPMEDKTVEWLFKNPIGDGGQFTGIVNLVTKYGAVPQEIMPETHSSSNTARMSQLLSLKLKEFALQLRETDKSGKNIQTATLMQKKTEMLGVIYRMLVLNLGEPPSEFTWTQKDVNGKPVSTKTYTPLSFYTEFVDVDMSDYVMIMNDPTREYNKVYEIEYDRHVYDGYNWKYLNLPIEEVKKMAIASIKDSTMLYFSCDVGKFLNRETGFLDVHNYDYASLMGTDFTMNKKQRIQTFSSGSSHAMTLCAVDLDEQENPKKWLLENSWGATYGYKGFLVMTDEWFDEYMFRLVVDKKYIPENIRELLTQKPILLPPWDPMFSMEE
ncbi:MAG: C1 family peptidase [Bacteroidales bacterium]|jgi:bleomycin hydrolase|nr:C1 family peptidase [Bacteroidales bacterium]